MAWARSRPKGTWCLFGRVWSLEVLVLGRCGCSFSIFQSPTGTKRKKTQGFEALSARSSSCLHTAEGIQPGECGGGRCQPRRGRRPPDKPDLSAAHLPEPINPRHRTPRLARGSSALVSGRRVLPLPGGKGPARSPFPRPSSAAPTLRSAWPRPRCTSRAAAARRRAPGSRAGTGLRGRATLRRGSEAEAVRLSARGRTQLASGGSKPTPGGWRGCAQPCWEPRGFGGWEISRAESQAVKFSFFKACTTSRGKGGGAGLASAALPRPGAGGGKLSSSTILC